jgi:ribosomal protein S18 acetylase RimI-like enzyme
MSEVVIRKCAPGDEGTLSLIGQATFLESFAGILPGKDILLHCARQHAVEKYAGWLREPASTIWLVEIEPKQAPIGYLVLTTPDLPVADISSGDVEIKRIYLLHRFQGAGIGRRLMEQARSHALAHNVRRLLLGVYARNREAIHFYEKLGYRAVGQRQFQIGEKLCDDLIMGLTLESGI